MHGCDCALIDPEPTSLILRAENARLFPSFREHGLRYIEVHDFAINVDRDHVPVFNERQWPARRRLG